TRKSRNLAKNPSCVISVILSGLDLVVEGTARLVTDEPTLQRLVKRYNAEGWPASVKDGAFTAEYSAPSAGPPPWNLYVATPSTARCTCSSSTRRRRLAASGGCYSLRPTAPFELPAVARPSSIPTSRTSAPYVCTPAQATARTGRYASRTSAGPGCARCAWSSTLTTWKLTPRTARGSQRHARKEDITCRRRTRHSSHASLWKLSTRASSRSSTR